MPEFKSAVELARSWIQAWNSHNVEAIMLHYAEGVKFQSPFVTTLTGGQSGKITGKKPLKEYNTKGLTLTPNLKFDLLQVLKGVEGMTIYYRRETGVYATETVVLNTDDQAVDVYVCYNAEENTDT